MINPELILLLHLKFIELVSKNYNKEKQKHKIENCDWELSLMKRMQQRETGIKRIIALSTIGIYDHPLKPVLKTYRKLADVIEGSGLGNTILRPTWFANEEECGRMGDHGNHQSGL